MDNFTYTSLVIITVFIMVILITIVKSNKNFGKETRKGLIVAFIFVIIGATSEWIVEMITNGYLYKFYDIWLIKFLESSLRLIKFILMPLMPVVASKAIFEDGEKSQAGIIIGYILKLYVLVGDLLLLVGFLYFTTIGPSDFYKDMMYNIYDATFIVSTIYLFVNAFHFNKRFQNRYQLELVEIMLLVVVGATIQIANLKVKTCWLTISVASSFIYIYYNELVQCVDGMTGLLNQKSFRNYIDCKENEEKKCTIIIMDVNDFKLVNDEYGHEAGNDVLIEVSRILKDTYKDYGKCYRIGGDEFAVIVQTEIEKIQELNDFFLKNLEKAREKQEIIPHISWGYSVYDPKNKWNHSLQDTNQEADSKMYENKKQFKAKRNTLLQKCEQQKAQE